MPDIWGTWRAAVRLLPLWRMPLEVFFSPSVWTLYGVDYMSGLLRNRSTRRLFELTAPLSGADLRRLHAIAQMNHRRHEVISRWMALSFVSVPVSAALFLSEVAPGPFAAYVAQRGAASWYAVLGYVGGLVVFYLLAAWRARQVLTVIEMACVERGLDLSDGGAGDEPMPELKA